MPSRNDFKMKRESSTELLLFRLPVTSRRPTQMPSFDIFVRLCTKIFVKRTLCVLSNSFINICCRFVKFYLVFVVKCQTKIRDVFFLVQSEINEKSLVLHVS